MELNLRLLSLLPHILVLLTLTGLLGINTIKAIRETRTSLTYARLVISVTTCPIIFAIAAKIANSASE